MQSGLINDGQITASSMWDSNHAPGNGRLGFTRQSSKAGAWCAKTNDVNQWIQVDLGSPTIVTGVITQGRDCTQWLQRVTKYKVQYSRDGMSWEFIKTANKSSVMVRMK